MDHGHATAVAQSLLEQRDRHRGADALRHVTRPTRRWWGGTVAGRPQEKGTTMHIYDVFEETTLKAHVVIPDEGPPTWDAFPDAWGQSVDGGGDPGGPRGDDSAGPRRSCLVLWWADDAPAAQHDSGLGAAGGALAAPRAWRVGWRSARARRVRPSTIHVRSSIGEETVSFRSASLTSRCDLQSLSQHDAVS